MYHLTASSLLFGLLASSAGLVLGAEVTKTTTISTSVPACTATSSTGSGAFFDLRPDMAVKADDTKAKKAAVTTDYHARGWDYGKNFTLNICGPVVEPPKSAVGVDSGLLKNISAFYESKGEVFSLGQASLDLKSRGRKLVLQYKGGSPCGASPKTKRDPASVHSGAAYRDYSDDDEPAPRADDDQKRPSDDKDKDPPPKEPSKDKSPPSAGAGLRKSATLSFICDPDQIGPPAVSFVAADPDECSYMFEVRSRHACSQAEPHKPGSVGPGSIFFIIFLIAVGVYFGGGVFYQRTVAHARGWRQLPNYSLWAGIWGFVKDIFIILTSSCARYFPSRRGYHYLSGSPTGRGRNREDENRLIDQLDEEWDD